jgi:succinyl-diaminopimelate desuccinylase
MIAACQEAVRIPSPSGEEAKAAAFLAERMVRLGADNVEVDEHSNVVAVFRGDGGGPSLMFNGHLDHVPPGDMAEPYSGALVDAARWGEFGEAIYGRGSCDMKCNVVAAAYALGAIRTAGVRLGGDAILVADVQEEVDSPLGVQAVLARGLRADYGLSVESTGLEVYIGHRGKVEFELDVYGKSCHSSEPERGTNAIYEMVRALEALRSLEQTLPSDPLLGRASLTPIDIVAFPGHGVAVVPDRCTIRIDRRFVPQETPADCLRQLKERLSRVKGLSFAIRQVNLYPLMYTDPTHPLVSAVQRCCEGVLGRSSGIGAWRFGVNGTFMAQAGIPTVGFGPGSERWAHTPEEHVLVQELVDAAKVYIMVTLSLCGVATV